MICQRYNVRRGQQLMADLPSDRLTPDNPPFTHVGIDFFGPLYVKRGRSILKHYGCLFTCLTMRATHIALRRFISPEDVQELLEATMGPICLQEKRKSETPLILGIIRRSRSIYSKRTSNGSLIPPELPIWEEFGSV